MDLTLALALGLALSAGIGLLAYGRGSLSRSGVLGAILTGTPIFAFGGVLWGALLVAFFVSSSTLSHYRARVKEPLADKFQKGSRRDLGQALANGGLGALLAIAYFFSPQPLLFAAYLGAIGSVTADTWATEIGVLNPRPPRLITTWRPVPVGTSGGITLLGTTVAALGALSIGLTAAVVQGGLIFLFHAPLPGAIMLFPVVTSIGGLGGSLVDSVLGATVQGTYYCDWDKKETESAIHRCGRPARRLRGWPWFDNDLVNLVSSAAGALLAVTAYMLMT